MITFIILFWAAFSLANAFCAVIFGSVEAIASICSLLIFAFIALAIGTRNNRAWTWMFLAIIVMVAVEVLAPYSSFIQLAISGVIALIGTITIKRPLIHYLNLDARRPINHGGPRIPVWANTLLRWI